MAEIHFGASLTPSKLELLEGWMGTQRWYAAKGAAPSLRRLHSFRFDDPAGEVGVETILVEDSAGPTPVIYQVPLTYRGAPLEGAETALIGTMEHSILGRRWVYDAPHDAVYAERLLAAILGSAQASSSSANDAPEPAVSGTRHPQWTTESTFVSSAVLGGEQSNTSITVQTTSADGAQQPLMLKVFRMLQPGHNPDVELQGALALAGCDRVPATVGHLSAAFDQSLDLAFAQEFLPGVEDAWREALRAVAAHEDFSEAARALGTATAEVHEALAEALGSTPTTPATVHRLVTEMRTREEAAVAEVPGLAAYAPAIAAVLAAVDSGPWPPMQRIHGDYHLGQVLHSPERGWILLDFEGEPLRPLSERVQPDQWIRDVAGMLRSFDYVGGSHELHNAGVSAREWVAAAQDAFLDGYAARSSTDPRDIAALLTAFQLDKAIYEVVYEARNRPEWLSIPLDAIVRLLPGGPAEGNSLQEVSS